MSIPAALRPRLSRAAALVPAALVLLASVGRAQRPEITPTRIESGRIVIDGVLDEAVWAEVARLGPLTQVEPVEGAPATVVTDVRIAYDAHRIYFGILCHDDPSEVRARQRDRDAFVRYDDVIELWLDTFDDERFAFWFQMTAGGSRGDALISDSGDSFNKNWDGIWNGRARVTDEGWVCEMAIPFQTLAFDEHGSTWGFNLQRKRIANGEEARWASPNVAYRFFRLSEGGVLLGLEGMEQGLGLDVAPYGKITSGRDFESQNDGISTTGDVGVDITYRPTPATTLRITTNTDFAETEVDERQFNLTRFPLFFPEKRDFFLEDAGVFEFGFPSRRRPSLVPFFSRTIGRDEDGKAVTILGGVKFTGRVGDWNIGLLDTVVDNHDGVSTKNLGVLRVSRNLGGENAAGAIVTSGRPLEGGYATTAGVDFRFGSSRAFGAEHSGTIWGYWLNTQTEGPGGEGHAFGLQGQASSATWRHRATALSTGSGFNPEMGFVRRTGIRQYSWSTEYTWRSDDEGPLREFQARIAPSFTTDTHGHRESWRVPLKWLELEFNSEDKIEFETSWIFERVDEPASDPFEVGDLTVDNDDYTMTRYEVRFESNDRRILNGDVEVEFGDFFGGDLLRIQVEPVLIPGPLFKLSLAVEDFYVDLGDDDFHTRLTSANFDFSFSPDVSWKNLVQYDTESKNLGFQSRLHWIVKPGHDLFLVGLFGWEKSTNGEPDHDAAFTPTGQEVTLKIAYTMRF